MKLNSLSHLKRLQGQRVLLRVDFNIPIGRGGQISPGAEIKLREALPTIEYLLKGGAQVIAVSHLGRPKKKEPKYSLKPVAKHLAKMLGKKRKVLFVADPLTKGKAVEKSLAKLGDGQLALLENIRYYPQEEKNLPAFARRLASLADIFVNDAFATAHRAHASTAGVTSFIKQRYAGLLMEREVANLSRLLEKPRKPFVVMMGGAKISSKLPTLKNLLKIADKVMLGGGMANAFFRAKGWSVGLSKVADEEVRYAKRLMADKKIVLPVDSLAASSISKSAKVRVVPADQAGPKDYLVDIGTETVRCYAAIIKKARTIAWNGPMGIFEIKTFSHGTVALGRIVAARSKGRAFGVVGGGETIAALELTGMAEWVDHVSTGGGAMLDFLSGKTLPGIKPLIAKK